MTMLGLYYMHVFVDLPFDTVMIVLLWKYFL